MAENIPDMDDILAQMKENFIETAHEKLDRMNEILEIFISGNGQNSALQEELRREIHSLKGLGGTFQMPMVSKLCHAFEEFLQPEVIFNPELSIQSQAFVDRIIAFMHDDKMNIATNKQDWLEGLPSKKEVSLQASDESIPLVLLSWPVGFGKDELY
jgi:chemotaxis protein histidine kinase CheA